VPVTLSFGNRRALCTTVALDRAGMPVPNGDKLMRAVMSIRVTCLLVAVAGCTNSAPTVDNPPAKLGFRVDWPGEPERRASDKELSGVDYVEFSYYADRTPLGYLRYRVQVTELGRRVSNESPRKLLYQWKAAAQEHELSRKEFEMGSKGLPGLEIVNQLAGLFVRSRTVIAGTRVYEAEVSSATRQALQSQQVQAFLDSFVVEE
jgi:hypothetical protein